MDTLSTLELMLYEIQNQKNLDYHEKMPVLPQRPVSKARMPSRRTRRAILSFHLQEFGDKKNDEFVDKSKGDIGFASVDSGLVLSKNNEDEKKKGILQIQKCFRGYQARFHYYKLKEGIITLQSFVRGENARREFRKWTKMATQMHFNQEFMWKPLRNKETTIIYLQSVIRDWLSRRHSNYIQDATTANNNDAITLHNDNMENEVLRTEAAIRQKKCENSILALQIQEIDTKWKLHKAEMRSKEKTWQDEFTSIQTSLASTQERRTDESIQFPQNPSRRHNNAKTELTIRDILELQESESSFHMHNIQNSKKCHKQELRKLKGQFKAWKKEFKARLQDIKKATDRSRDRRTKRVHKSCWVAIS